MQVKEEKENKIIKEVINEFNYSSFSQNCYPLSFLHITIIPLSPYSILAQLVKFSFLLFSVAGPKKVLYLAKVLVILSSVVGTSIYFLHL